MKAWELSKVYFEESLLPLIRRRYPAIEKEMAVGVFGMGSDASGLDDEHSRDHHWGPRCNFLLSESFQPQCAEIEAFLQREAPPEFQGYEVYHLKYNRSGITVETVGEFFQDMVGQPQAPAELADWFAMTEADLYHVVNGQVFYDATGEYARRRAGFAYFPDPIWRKKLADWLVFTSGHGTYNINRARNREDWATTAIYLGVTVKRILEVGHLVNRTYAPYNKWLYRSFQRLPLLSGEVVPLLDRILANADWEEKIHDLIRINVCINDELHRQGLTRRYYPSGPLEINEAWLHFLYDAATELYHSISEPLVWGRFRDIEKWEQVVKQVLMTPNWKAGFAELKEEETKA